MPDVLHAAFFFFFAAEAAEGVGLCATVCEAHVYLSVLLKGIFFWMKTVMQVVTIFLKLSI